MCSFDEVQPGQGFEVIVPDYPWAYRPFARQRSKVQLRQRHAAVRSFSMVLVSIRDTCICDTPIFAAI